MDSAFGLLQTAARLLGGSGQAKPFPSRLPSAVRKARVSSAFSSRAMASSQGSASSVSRVSDALGTDAAPNSKSPRSITRPRTVTVACCIVLRSSRTLPGQGWESSAWEAAGDNRLADGPAGAN